MATRSPTATSIVKPTLSIGAVAATLALLTANPGLTVAAVLALVTIVLLTWRPAESPVLLFICTMQWLQASAKVLHANALGEELHALPAAHHLAIGAAGTIENAALLSLAWVVVVALGIRIARWRTHARAPHAVEPTRFRLSRLLALYLASTMVLLALSPFATGGLRQVVVAGADLRWAVVFVLFSMVLQRGGSLFWLALVFVAEVAAGWLSYFASFRVPVYLLAIAVVSGPVLFRPRQIAGLVMVSAVAVYLGVLWSAVKTDYRFALNRGTGAQVVAISKTEQVEKLVELVGTIDGETMVVGVERLVDRLGYIDYFAYCMEHVPALRAHEGGLLWRQALAHVFQPRILFPDKPTLESDTLTAERYTGLDLMSWTGTTSVALGLPAEAYVDFGVPGMFLAALWVGLLCGLAFRVVSGRGRDGPLRDALAVALLLPLATLEPSTTKFLGGYLTRLILALIVLSTVLPGIGRWVLPGAARASGTPPLGISAQGSRVPRQNHVPTR